MWNETDQRKLTAGLKRRGLVPGKFGYTLGDNPKNAKTVLKEIDKVLKAIEEGDYDEIDLSPTTDLKKTSFKELCKNR